MRYDDRRRQLFWDLRSRILTDEEMGEVAAYGKYINIEPMESFSETEKAHQLNDALLQQFRLKSAINKAG